MIAPLLLLAAAASPEAVEPGGEAAAQVVRRYYARIAAKQYRAARALWGDGGARSGRSPARFAAQFERFARYRAAIGPAGRVDAGMLQRWVEVPVTLSGITKSGTRFRLDRKVILHRVADVEGASAEQRRWHIARIVS